MSEILMTLCDQCAEKMDANRHPENRYYLKEVLGSHRKTQCIYCLQNKMCCQYSAKSKAVIAMERALTKKQAEQGYTPKHDTRAHYREPWRDKE